jgi:hypothetical protein
LERQRVVEAGMNRVLLGWAVRKTLSAILIRLQPAEKYRPGSRSIHDRALPGLVCWKPWQLATYELLSISCMVEAFHDGGQRGIDAFPLREELLQDLLPFGRQNVESLFAFIFFAPLAD